MLSPPLRHLPGGPPTHPAFACPQAPLSEIDFASLDETVNRFHKMVFKMERGLVPNKARVCGGRVLCAV